VETHGQRGVLASAQTPTQPYIISKKDKNNENTTALQLSRYH